MTGTIIITRKTAADDGFGGKVENTAIRAADDKNI